MKVQELDRERALASKGGYGSPALTSAPTTSLHPATS